MIIFNDFLYFFKYFSSLLILVITNTVFLLKGLLVLGAYVINVEKLLKICKLL